MVSMFVRAQLLVSNQTFTNVVIVSKRYIDIYVRVQTSVRNH